jgi:CRISPR-associated protein Csh2
MPVRTGEILFVKCVKNGIPNRDPLRDSDARRIFPEDDGRISLSDVSIKRDVRDYVLARFPEGSEQADLTRLVFVQKKLGEDGRTLLGRDGLATAILDRVRLAKEKETGEAETATVTKPKKKPKPPVDADAESDRDLLLRAAFDMRVFGAVFSVKGKSFNQTGPVQFGWANSLHPVETKYTQGTVVMPSADKKISDRRSASATDSDNGDKDDDEAEDRGKTQGTIWSQYQLPFAVFSMPGVINATIAAQTVMDDDDVDLLLAGLWKGTLHRQARGRGLQQPLLLLHVEYTDPFFRIGFLEEGLRLDTLPDEANRMGRARWQGGNPPSELSDVILNVEGLAERLDRHKSQIARARVWTDPYFKLDGTVPAERGTWPQGV